MDQNTLTKENTETVTNQKKPLCIWSLAAFLTGFASSTVYFLILGSKLRALIPLWVILGVVSLLLPTVAKKIRLSKNQSGKKLEIAAIILGGFAFYTVIWLMTNISVYVGYLGWIIGGVIYKFVGREDK